MSMFTRTGTLVRKKRPSNRSLTSSNGSIKGPRTYSGSRPGSFRRPKSESGTSSRTGSFKRSSGDDSGSFRRPKSDLDTIGLREQNTRASTSELGHRYKLDVLASGSSKSARDLRVEDCFRDAIDAIDIRGRKGGSLRGSPGGSLRASPAGSLRRVPTGGSLKGSIKYPRERRYGGSLKLPMRENQNGSLNYSACATSTLVPDPFRLYPLEPTQVDSTKYTNNRHRESPLRSVTDTVVSFDDEKQLMRTSLRTSVGWGSIAGDVGRGDGYGNCMYLLQEAGKESENVLEFACKASSIICNTLLVTILVGISITVPIAMVSIGIKYLDDCPKQPRIPVYLLVGGCCGTMKLVSSLWRNVHDRRNQDDVETVFDDHDSDSAFASTTYRTMDFMLLIFLLGWQVAGTVWTMNIWSPHYKQLLHEPSNWCDKTVYMFTVIQIAGGYCVMAVYMTAVVIVSCWYKCSTSCFHETEKKSSKARAH